MATLSPPSTGRFAGHYDRDVDIVWVRFEGYDGASAVSVETPWGLEERDPESGQVTAIEIWRASEALPEAFLALLPEPGPQRELEQLERFVDGSIEWLRDHYWDQPFWLDRDIVWMLQKRLAESFRNAGVQAQVVHDFSLPAGQEVDLAILVDGAPRVVLECKYEPASQRHDFATGRLGPVVSWDRNGVLDDIRGVCEAVISGTVRAGYSIFVDEGGRFGHRKASPMSTWFDWSSDHAKVSVLLTRIDVANARPAREWLAAAPR